MVLSIVESLGKLRPQPATVIQVRFELTSHLDAVYGKAIIAYQRLGYDSLTLYTGLHVQHGLPNPIVVSINARTCSLSSAIAKPSYMFSHWSRPHVGLAIYAIMRG